MGVAHHANYLVWFEVGRGDYFRSLGQDYMHWEQAGYLLPYHAPARYGALITVQTWLEQVRSRSVKLGYRVIDAGTRECLATGWTQHICADRNGRMRRLPAQMLDSLTGHD